VGPVFNATADTNVSGDTDCLANADIGSTFVVGDDPWPAAQYEAQISFSPGAWGIAESADIPIGAVVGKLVADATLGWFNSPCSAAYGGSLHIEFDPMLNCSIDTSDTVTFAEQFADTDGNMIQQGCDQYPDFLNTMFPGMTPRTRHAAFEFIGINVSLNFMTFEPGTTIPLPGVPSFSSDLGYVAMSVLNDPTAPLVKDQITDNCPPLSTATTYYGLTKNNPYTAPDEAGYKWRTNPEFAGTYTFNGYAGSIADADGDNIDNEMDSCPYIADTGDPRVLGSGDSDSDGLPDTCDPDPTGVKVNCTGPQRDCDNDGFPNRQDNCPLMSNGDQADGDYDGIGNACDQNSTTPDGDKAERWFATDVEISGSSCIEPGADTDGDGFEDADEANSGSCWKDPCDEKAFCSATEAADSTPEDGSVAGSCSDEKDNDLDGYMDDVDGGCGDDTDKDGVSDDGEDDLGSDPDDKDSAPEDASVCDVCTDSVDNDGDGDTDAADEGCAGAEATPTAVDTDGDTVPDDEETALGSDPNDPESTPEDASIEGTCTDGVDNDGDGLTDDEDEGCAVTPTATAEVEICAPVFPGTYNGLVRINGQPAASGYEVTARIGDVQWGSAIVSGGRYAMDIPDHMPTTKPCFDGGTIIFALNGMTCTPVEEGADEWHAGIRNVDLNCAPVAPPVTPTVTPPATPPATPTTVATPTVTPAKPPPSGAGGLSGPSAGLPLWATALSGWAGLMIVAGLGSLMAAKRR
jgi:hypothetical protein